MIKVTIAMFMAILFSGCFPEPKPCVPLIIKEPYEVKVPIKCQHSKCEQPQLYVDNKSDTYYQRSQYHKANDKLKEKFALCLEDSISLCEGNSTK